MIAVLGLGAMGAAVATHLRRVGHDVVAYATDHDDQTVRDWRAGSPHPALGRPLDPDLAVRDLTEARGELASAELIAVTVSSPGLEAVLSQVAGCASPDAVWMLATKGWHERTHQAPSELAATILGAHTPIVTLAGPGLASEIAAGAPTALLCASRNRRARRLAAEALTSPSMFVLTTGDVAGAETASAYKNVVAIAVGIAEGVSERLTHAGPLNGRDAARTFANARAAMFAQGMMDMVGLAEARGGRSATVLGLAGAGDLYVTCVGGRNGKFGKLLGAGLTAAQALSVINSTVEGVANTRVALALAERYAIELPTARAVDLALRRHLGDEEGLQQLRQLFTATMWPRFSFPAGLPATVGAAAG